MIYKFKSQADADVIMLEANGDQMLTIIGRKPSAQGIITAEQIPAAIAALEAAILTHEASESRAHEQTGTEIAANGDSVRLRARATPLIALLRNSAGAAKDVVWGV
jgi:cyclopropane-fatty-acyl-phospholipid synthase